MSIVVPALCAAGDANLEDVAAAWDCHEWSNCPMQKAFGAESIKNIPPLFHGEVKLFVQFFDAGVIPPLRRTESGSWTCEPVVK